MSGLSVAHPPEKIIKSAKRNKTAGNLQAIICKMPVKVNLIPLGRVNSWATNTNKARMVKTQASTEVACTAWR